MGVSNSKKSKKPSDEIRFNTLGLYNSGKSSLIYRLKHGEPPNDTVATIGYEYHEVHQDGIKIHAFDYTGRGHWGLYTRFEYIGASGIIFMIDSADASCFDDSLEVLDIILGDENIPDMTIMVVANKQDLDDALGPEEVEKQIKQQCKIRKNGITLFVMPMSVTAGDDHSVQLAFRLFFKTMKRKQQKGKVQSGLIPHAWKTAEKEAEDSDVEDDGDETKVADKDGIIMAKEKERKLAFTIEGKKKSFFKDPVHIFKSILIH